MPPIYIMNLKICKIKLFENCTILVSDKWLNVLIKDATMYPIKFQLTNHFVFQIILFCC